MLAGTPQPLTEMYLSQVLAVSPGRTFVVYVETATLSSHYIFPGDILICDGLKCPTSKCIVIASQDGEVAVKLYSHINTLHLCNGQDWHVWGVVTHIIHTV